jgi:hypothetical protein
VSAAADPRTIEDCEKIQAADAYNQCLASFGPVQHERGVTADPESSGGNGGSGAKSDVVAEKHSSRHAHGRGASRHASSRHGDPWAHMRHASSGGRKHAAFRVK